MTANRISAQRTRLSFHSLPILSLNSLSTLLMLKIVLQGLPWQSSGLESTLQCKGHWFDLWSGKIPHATKQLSLGATTTEPALWSPRTTLLNALTFTTEARMPRTPVLQQEKPPL